jgi:hypothetical protein
MRGTATHIPDRRLWYLVGVSVALRLGAVMYFGDDLRPRPGVADQLSYHALAERVRDGFGFSFAEGWWPATPAGQPTAHWSFLYVSLIAGVYELAGPHPVVVRALQALLVGVAHPLLTWRLTSRVFGTEAALAAAGLVAVYGYFVYYAGALMTEALYGSAVLWSLDLAVQADSPAPRPGGRPYRTWLLLGVALAAAVLLRQVFLLCAPLVLTWSAWRSAQHRSRWAVASQLALATAVLVVAILPWTMRNQRVFGTLVPLNTNAGFAFYWGNHPVHGRRFQPLLDGPEYGALLPAELRHLNEGQMDAALLGRGLAFVTDDPSRYVLLSLGRLAEYVKFWPSRESRTASNIVRALSFGLCAPLMVLGILRFVRGQSKVGVVAPVAWLLLLVVAAHSSMYVLTWTLVRYRIPVDAMLMPFAGAALASILEGARAHRLSPAAAGIG